MFAKFALSKLIYRKTNRIDQYILTVTMTVLCLQNLTFSVWVTQIC